MKTWELLDQQCGDYQAMYSLAQEQWVCLEREDLPALEASFAQMHRIMNRIYLRQRELSMLAQGDPESEARRAWLRRIIAELQEVCQANQRVARRLLERTRGEIRQVDRGKRASQEYRGSPLVLARLVDNTR